MVKKIPFSRPNSDRRIVIQNQQHCKIYSAV